MKTMEKSLNHEGFSEKDDEDQMPISQLHLSPKIMRKSLGIRKRHFGSSYKDENEESFDESSEVGSNQRKRAAIGQDHDDIKANDAVMERAIEVQQTIPPGIPSFIKTMYTLNVVRGFCVKFPTDFCRLHLPMHDPIITLVNENGEEYETSLDVERTLISAGWRKFVSENELLEDDVLIFLMVQPSKFKVYIIRANGLPEVDAALCLLNLHGSSKMNCGKDHLRPLQPARDQEEMQKKVDESVDMLEDIENFTIIVNGLAIDSEFPSQLRTKYYELCRSKKSLLHDNLVQTIDPMLAVNIISDTVKICDAIKASTLSTDPSYFDIWDRTLKGFQKWGMNIGFLRARLNSLLNLIYAKEEMGFDSSETETERLDNGKNHRQFNAKKLKLMFMEAVNAPW